MSLQESDGNSALKCQQDSVYPQDAGTSLLFDKCGEIEQLVTLETDNRYRPTFDGPRTVVEGGQLLQDTCSLPSFQDTCTLSLSCGLNRIRTYKRPNEDDSSSKNEAVMGTFTRGIFEPLHMQQVGSNWDDLLVKGSSSKEVAGQIATASTTRSHETRTIFIDAEVNDCPSTDNMGNNSFRVQFVRSLKGVTPKEKRSRNVKFFSHELGVPKSYPQSLPRTHSDNHLENMLEALRISFDTAKEETNMELAHFAIDLVEILDTCTESLLNWKEKVEDLLILVRHCAIMSVCDFQEQCERIVQELECECHELPTGFLKALQTRLLFILTRCTRILRLHKEAEPHAIGSLEKLQECLRGLPSYERVWVEKKGKLSHGTDNGLLHMVEKDVVVGADCLLYPNHRGASHERLVLKHSENKFVDDEPLHLICRICEEEVLLPHLEAHSAFCAFADACDMSGLSVNERLINAADCLEKLSDFENNPDFLSHLRLNLQDHSNTSSPKWIGLSDQNAESKPNQVKAFSSVGSLTPRSCITTPSTSHFNILWKEHNVLVEADDVHYIHELVDIARCVANRNSVDEDTLDYLAACMEDLQNVLRSCRSEAVAVFTFGRRIEDFLREKDMLVLDLLSHQKADIDSTIFEDDSMVIEDHIYDLKSTPSIPLYKDRTTINDFEILKPISHGAFGKVFLARKRTTGDLFAIKVLRKVDMIRKNAVESILAERDILISVCNPFVVRFFYSFTCKENLYLVMEYLNGGDLFSLLKSMGSLDEHVACIYIAELVLALEYIHSLGIVHRDLKPDNVLVSNDGHIKLTDFGLSKVGLINSTDDFSTTPSIKDPKTTVFDKNDPDHKAERINKQSAVGTPDYLAPEILLGKEHGYSADWWSVGIILFECLTGMPPFSGNHPQSIFENILNREIPWPEDDDISEQARDLIDKLLIQNPSKRLGSQGAHEVKSHPFFQNINWDTLAMQKGKVAFVPSPESVDDTCYFTPRPLYNALFGSREFPSNSIIGARTEELDEERDSCGVLADSGMSGFKASFHNFSFKNLPQLASMNYDIFSHSTKDFMKGSS